MSKRVALYVRVSTKRDQTTQNQVGELQKYCERQGWQVVETYDDSGVSGAKADRPALSRMMRDAAKGKFQVVCVWKIDRLARSVSDLLNILSLLRSHGVDFVSATQAIDTTTSYGKMVMTFLGAIAEFERDLICERVKVGIERAKSEGTVLGRPRVAIDIRRAIQLRDDGHGYKQIAKVMGVPRTTLYRSLSAIPQTPAAANA
jgi:DNA invertase Pin-like site-specific DNA recombinase